MNELFVKGTLRTSQTLPPAHHALTTGHNIAWNDINILTTTSHRSQLDLLEHAGIRTQNPQMNRNAAAPNINSLWNPLLSKINSTFKARPSNITYKNYSWFTIMHIPQHATSSSTTIPHQSLTLKPNYPLDTALLPLKVLTHPQVHSWRR